MNGLLPRPDLSGNPPRGTFAAFGRTEFQLCQLTPCIHIILTESEFCPPGAALLSEFQRMQAFNHKQQYPKVPFLPLLSLILLSAVKRADRVPTLSINSLHTYNSDRIGILLSAVKRADRVPTLSIYQGCMPPCHIRQNRN